MTCKCRFTDPSKFAMLGRNVDNGKGSAWELVYFKFLKSDTFTSYFYERILY